MSFLYPQFLWALLALAIPILIHLFHFRRYKTVYFSNLRFLKNLQEQTQQQQKLKHLLVLLCRLLTICFLVLAFAQPFLSENKTANPGAQRTISVFIDNSYSMTHTGSSGELLEQAKAKARELAEAFGESDRFQLITQDLESRHQRLVSKRDFLQWVDEVKPTFMSNPLSRVLDKQNQALSKAHGTRKSIYLISDFQETQTDAAKWKTDSATSLQLIPLTAASPANIYVDSCWFISPYVPLQQPVQLMARVRNTGGNNIKNNSVVLKINNQQRALGGFEIQADTYTDVMLSFTLNTPGSYAAELAVTDHPVTFDDRLYFAFDVRKEVKILHVYAAKPDAHIEAVYAADPYCKVTAANDKQMDYAALNTTDVVVLDGLTSLSSGLQNELSRFIHNGGSVMVFPPALPNQSILPSYTEWLKSEGIFTDGQLVNSGEHIHQLHTESEVLEGVFEKTPRNPDMPKVTRYYRLNNSRARKVSVILSMKNEDAIWCMYEREKGKIYVSSVPLQNDWSNLSEHAFFVPLMLRAAYLSEARTPLYYQLNAPTATLPFAPESNEKTVVLKKEKSEIILPVASNGARSTLYLNDQLKEAGIYTISTTEQGEHYLGINYSREESGTVFLTPEQIQALNPTLAFTTLETGKKPIAAQLAEQEAGSRLWKLCVVLALVFLLIEILLLKFYRP